MFKSHTSDFRNKDTGNNFSKDNKSPSQFESRTVKYGCLFSNLQET